MKYLLANTLVCICLFFGPVTGQELPIAKQFNCVDTAQHFLYQIDLPSKTFTRFDRKGNRESFPLEFIAIKSDDIPPEVVNNYFQLAPHLFLITVSGTGQVYQFHALQKTLERIDKTFYRGNNFGAIQFIRKDTIFSVGGQGFWRIHSIPTYFNAKSKEWDYYSGINEQGPQGISSRFGGYNSKADQLYSLEYPPLYQEKSEDNYPFYRFDFNKHAWKEIGFVKFDNPNMKNFAKQNSHWVYPFFFSSDIDFEEFIDPVANKIYRYQGQNHSFFLLAIQLYVKGNKLYSFQRTYNQNKFEIKLDSMDINALKKSSIVLGDFYTPNVWYNKISWSIYINYLYIGIIAILVWLIYLLTKNKKHKKQNIWNQLPAEANTFLKFITKKDDLTCTTDELNTLLGCADKSIESQRQYRSKFITTLNVFFERYFEIADAITRNQSATDKRYVDYQLKREASENLKNLP
jgi:hypothetical protein